MVSHAGAWRYTEPKKNPHLTKDDKADSALPYGSAGSFPNVTQLGENNSPSSPLVPVALQRHQHDPHFVSGSPWVAKGEI